MNLRDYFAATIGIKLSSSLTAQESARMAYDVADALMEERSRRMKERNEFHCEECEEEKEVKVAQAPDLL